MALFAHPRSFPPGPPGIVPALLLALGLIAAEGLADPAVLGFEAPAAWQTAPPLTQEFAEADLWSSVTIPFKDLAGGATLSTDHVQQGVYSLRWADHPRYPTLHATIPLDLSDFRGIGFWAWSDAATGEKVTLACESDNPQTAWKDYFVFTFAVDWSGWRQVQVPLEQFARLGEPSGWPQVQGLYCFTKAFNHQPNPYTVLYLDDLKPVTTAPPPYPAPSDSPARSLVTSATGRLPHKGESPEFDPTILNHHWPEVRVPAEAPFQYQPYFLHERALYGYYPRFEPGFVSFDPQGQPYLLCNGTIIETLGADGKWQYRDLLEEVIEPKHLAIPYKPYYKIWMHKLVLDPVRERLFLTYWSQTPTECLFKDEYLAALFIWPDREKAWLTESETKAPPLGTYRQEPRKYAFYSAPPSELCILLSEDHGDTWRLATTPDFRGDD
jgi:hypothetical protein